ncbi:TldD/PmbA family protein [Candidatus Saganbacteria bacterium]|nr:TldD/PmbA family protein [Candidatus Saganbacteria bacterium]
MPIDLQELISKALRSGAVQAEVFQINSKTLKIDVLDQKIESIDNLQDGGLGLRVIDKEKRLGFSYSTEPEEDLALHHMVPGLAEAALANARFTKPDENHSFPGPVPSKSAEYFDPSITSASLKQKIDLTMQVESAAYNYDKRVKKTEKISYSDSETEVRIVNSNGLDIHYKTNNCGASADVIAEQGSEAESGLGISYVTRFADLKAKDVGEEAARRAGELLGAKTIGPQKIPLVLDPLVGAQILGTLSPILSSDSVQKGKSLFADKMGQQVGSNILVLIDDGKLKNGVASAPFDDEGTPSQKTILVENGVLKSFLFNSYTAVKGKTRSTGNAKRTSYKSLPEIAPTNIYIKPGEKSSPDCRKGLYITRVMGMHMVNPISGDFSIGAAGIMIENGEKTYPVRGITIAGNLTDLLKGIEVICSDLRFVPFSANLGSPTLLVTGLSISG